jgi:hypothetical protein
MKDIKQSLKKREKNDIIVWSYDTKRSKLLIINDSTLLIKKINDNKPINIYLGKKMINLHNEYRFPLSQIIDITQENVDIAYQFLIFLSKTNK